MKKIAIMGTGSLGTILGAYLSRAGLSVTLIDAWKDHVNALNQKGAKVSGTVNMLVPVKACTPDEMEGNYDLFIYLAKQTFNDTAIPQMIAHCHKNTIICTGQNGLPEMAVAEFWPKANICGMTVGWSASLLRPGESSLNSPEDSSLFGMHLGTLIGPVTDWLLEVKAILEKMCPIILTDNLIGDRWSKLTGNALSSGMSTVIDGTFGDVYRSDRALTCAVRIGRECLQVCKAIHVTMPPAFGIDMMTIFDYNNTTGEQKAKDTVRKLDAAHGKGKASMLQDLEKGKKCEIAYIDGVVSKTGREVGIETPYADAVVRIVSEIEDGKRPLSPNNLNDMPNLPL